MAKGPLIIISGPSGSGKSTVIARLLARRDLPLHLSVSATTRQPRPSEVNGRDYWFLPKQEFLERIARDEFLEHAEVHGNCYGTLKEQVEPFREKGEGVILDIDVQGAAQVRVKCPDHVSIFLQPPSQVVLEQRLRDRHTETEQAIELRLRNAARELTHAGEYQYQVVNDEVERAVQEIHSILVPLFGRP
ncbi:MAG TPA: guanylate kinase [Gemmataceae bacterium]|nr:guanylate kinase [Gemmataceae bacterium]